MPNRTVSASQLSNLRPDLHRRLLEIAEKTIRPFLRRYRHHITEHKVKFKYALINYCVAGGFTIIVAVIANRQGTTYMNL